MTTQPPGIHSGGCTQSDQHRPSAEADDTTCPRCAESRELAKVKGCVKCLACGFKFDCNGW